MTSVTSRSEVRSVVGSVATTRHTDLVETVSDLLRLHRMPGELLRVEISADGNGAVH
jgi:4-hydroxy-3-methylbut-2-en-1-yl diphosphate synthase IspG/GcpE